MKTNENLIDRSTLVVGRDGRGNVANLQDRGIKSGQQAWHRNFAGCPTETRVHGKKKERNRKNGVGEMSSLRELEERLLNVEKELRFLQEQWRILGREPNPHPETVTQEVGPYREGSPEISRKESSVSGEKSGAEREVVNLKLAASNGKIRPLLPGWPSCSGTNLPTRVIGIPNDRIPEEIEGDD